MRALGEADTVAFYVQDQMELSEQWKALLGVRWERYKADVAHRAATRPVRPPPDRSSARTTCVAGASD